ncbi:MAG: MFS transporter [Rhodothermales bacterium]
MAALFEVSERLSDEQRASGLRNVIRDGMASQAMASLTGSAILVAFAIQLNASNKVIGLLAAIPHLSQLIQLPAIGLVRRIGNRRVISVVASVIGRFAWVLVAAAPFFLPEHGVLMALVFGLFAASVLAAIANCGWNSWMHELVPSDQLGSFFGRRFSLATTAGAVVSLAAGLFIDKIAPSLFSDVLYGYSLVFTLGFLFGIVGVYFVSRIPEPRYRPATGPIASEIRKPFKDRNFRNLVIFLTAWNVAVYLATPFFSVYMLKRLDMDLTWVIGLIVFGRFVNIMFLRIWGSFSDRISHKSVLAVSAPLALICILGWTFTTMPEKHFLTFPLLVTLHVLMGIAMAGITLATGNIGLKLAPKGEGISYLASINVFNALAAGLAPLFSGGLVDFFVTRRLSWTIQYASPTGQTTIDLLNFQQWDFLFFLSFVIGLYAVHRLSMVVEQGEVEEKVVVSELVAAFGRELREFSTVATIRNVANLVPLRSDRRPSDEITPDF